MTGILACIAFCTICAITEATNRDERVCLTLAFVVNVIGIVALCIIG